MIARTHDTAAFASLSLTFLLFQPNHISLATVIVAVLANLLGGIAPDIDQPTAPFWRNLPVGKYFGRLFSVVVGGHRFLSHSLIGLALFGYGVHWLLVALQPVMAAVDIDMVLLAFMIGMVSHLVLDSFTKEGVPWLLPLPYKFGIPPLKRLRITTDSWVETGIVFPLLVSATLVFYFLHYDQLVNVFHRVIVR